MRHLPVVAALVLLQGCYLFHERPGSASDSSDRDGGPAGPEDAAPPVDAATTCVPIESVVIPGSTEEFGFVAGAASGTVVDCAGTDLKVIELVRGAPPAPWGIEAPVTPAYRVWLLDPARATTDDPCGECFQLLDGARVIELPPDLDRVMVGFPRSTWSGMPLYATWYGD